MATRTVTRNFPKRKIEHVNAALSHQIASSVVDLTLHEVEDSETLVRTIAHLEVGSYDTITNHPEEFDMLLSIQPGGQSTKAPSVGQSLDKLASKMELGRFKGGLDERNSSELVVWDFDSKGMRKLEPGDQVVYSDVCQTSNILWVRGWVQMYFKT